MDLHLSHPYVLRYWACTPDQHRQTNRLYPRMRIGAAQRDLSRNNGEALPSAGLRLCYPHRLAPPLPRHGAS